MPWGYPLDMTTAEEGRPRGPIPESGCRDLAASHAERIVTFFCIFCPLPWCTYLRLPEEDDSKGPALFCCLKTVALAVLNRPFALFPENNLKPEIYFQNLWDPGGGPEDSTVLSFQPH